MALRGKAKWKQSGPHKRRPLLEKQGGSFWQSRSQPFVTRLIVGLMNGLRKEMK